MGSIVDFESAKLAELLSKHGIQKTWLSILRRHLNGLAHLRYITDSEVFRDTFSLERDLLDGLTIGEISVLYEFSLATLDPDSRKQSGQFFTPDDVSDFMAEHSHGFPEGVWLDPCAGVGNLSWHLVKAQAEPEEFLLTRLIVSDRDELALMIARTLLTKEFQKDHPRLFEELQDRFVKFDFLSVGDDGVGLVNEHKNALEQIPLHDFAILNPPYLATDRDFRFETAQAGDLYSYFLENVIKTSSGFISVTPQSFTNAEKFRTLRRLLLSKFDNLTIFTFDNVPGNLFRGIKFGSTNSNTANSIRAAITVARPGPGTCQITPLLRWRNLERRRLMTSATNMLGPATFTEDFFPKVGADFTHAYEELTKSETIRELTSPDPTLFPLYVPTSPRYFISALKTPVKRASIRTLYFATEEHQNRAYLVLNSSLAYWWWRVRDGGMTLSQETLLSVPVTKFVVSATDVASLEKSEANNKVYKMNAGEAQENVKHPLELVAKINERVVPKYARLLLTAHRNSHFSDS